MKNIILIILLALVPSSLMAQVAGGTIKRSAGRKTGKTVFKNKEMISSPTGYVNGHGYVDLGLSVKWATTNLGARSYHDKGNYYLFGAVYDNEQGVSQIESNIEGNEHYDAARFNWRESWRLPTKQEFEELLNNCTWEKTIIRGVSGYVVTGHNGNCIFLPLTGSYMLGKELDVTGYRTGSCESQSGILKSTFPLTLNIDGSNINIGSSPKNVRLPIRAVTK